MRANPIILRRERRIRLAAFLSVLGLILFVLLKMKTVSIAFLLSILTVYMLKPLVTLLERRGTDKTLAISSVFITIIAVLSLTIYFTAPLIGEQVTAFQGELPRYKDGLMALVTRVEDSTNKKFGEFYHLDIAEHAMPFFQNYLIESLETLPAKTADILTILILAPLFAFFLLRDGHTIKSKLLSIVPNHLFELTLSLSHKINEQIGGFIRARLLEALIVGFVVWLGLAMMSFPYAVILAIFAGITNLIPYIGPIIGAVPALLVATIDNDSSMILLVTLVYIIAQIIDMAFIIPLVVAKIVNLHPVLVVIAIMAGAELGGIVGMIISIPVTSAIILILSTFYKQLLAQNSD